MIILLTALVVITAIGIAIAYQDGFGFLDSLGWLMLLFGGICTFVIAIAWPMSYADSKAQIYKYEAIKQTIESARSNPLNDIERAALTQKIIDVNTDLASAKYYNNTIFGDAISDDLTNLPYLK